MHKTILQSQQIADCRPQRLQGRGSISPIIFGGILLLSGVITAQTASAQQANLNNGLLVPSNPAPADSSSSAERAAYLNTIYGYRGWDVPVPSFDQSLSLDAGYWRTDLAKYGFGLLFYDFTISQANVLDTPRGVPAYFPACVRTSAEAGTMCAGNRSYFGQRPDVYEGTEGILTYDTSRWGVPDGLITIGATFSKGTDLAYEPEVLKMELLSWYQTLFNRRVELEAGYLQATQEFLGQTVGGNFANLFGPNSTVAGELGMSNQNSAAPMFRTTFHITGDRNHGIYEEAAVQRSLPVNGFYPGALENETVANPTGFGFLSSVKGTGALFVDEVGWRQESQTNQLSQWFRAGTVYNTSNFKDLSRISVNPIATTDGSGGSAYVLMDQQIFQPSKANPRRGIYAGFTYMYADPKIANFYQYEEGRVYMKGPFESRPGDMVSFIYDRNTVSPFVADSPTAFNAVTGVSTRHFSNSYTLSYLLKLLPGAWVTTGVGFTDHPSVKYFRGEGSALNLLASVYIVL